MGSRYETGMRVRRAVLGRAHVAHATAARTALDADFQRFITETAWGAVWARPGLDRRTRSLVTIAILAALGREELRLHLRASRNVGVPPKEIAEVLLHVAIYAGIPAANAAFAAAKAILAPPRPRRRKTR
jgi:4-carboxymuconolactone decarboxylase